MVNKKCAQHFIGNGAQKNPRQTLHADQEEIIEVLRMIKNWTPLPRMQEQLESAMPCKAQRNSEKGTLNNSTSNSWRDFFCRSSASCTKAKSQIPCMLTKLMLMNLDDALSTKAVRSGTKSTLQTVDAIL